MELFTFQNQSFINWEEKKNAIWFYKQKESLLWKHASKAFVQKYINGTQFSKWLT